LILGIYLNHRPHFNELLGVDVADVKQRSRKGLIAHRILNVAPVENCQYATRHAAKEKPVESGFSIQS
jgi:hypothetical protein